MRHKRIAEHKAASNHCTDAEWEAILTATLVEGRPPRDIDVRAEVADGGAAVELCVRKNIGGITVRLLLCGHLGFPLFLSCNETRKH